jgi:hypothetical protein
LLAQRAASEGPRWTRAVEGNPAPPLMVTGWGFDYGRTGSQVGAKGEEGIT